MQEEIEAGPTALPVENGTAAIEVPIEVVTGAVRPGEPSFIVGVGASAGGLEALEHFFHAMPEDNNLAFVVVQHLSPDFKSVMDELLARHTAMPIHRICEGMALEPGSVYLIPAKKNVLLREGRFQLEDQESKGLHLPIDVFLRSLAEDARDRAIAVILSGTGTDGSRGIRHIHGQGGLVLVQAPESAAFDGMPRAAIATGLADIISPPEAMASRLMSYAQHPTTVEDRKGNEPDAPGPGEELLWIQALLRSRFAVDFKHYKLSTVQRRIERRVSLSRASSLGAYLRRLREDSEELDALFRDLLVEVTDFFRDPEAFSALETLVLPRLVDNISLEEGIRVWVPACATGEEAYSIAMLLHELLETNHQAQSFKVFATDVHRSSLEFASHGAYSESSVQTVPPRLLNRYFHHQGDRYVIRQELRNTVVFAPHDLTRDPPFTRIDLVSCRNALIYFRPETQRRILSSFHFGLRPRGFLFLGPSETVGDIQEEFDILDGHWKIFEKRRDVLLPQREPMMVLSLASNLLRRRGQEPRVPSEFSAPPPYEPLLARFVPPGLLINEAGELIHTFGYASRYLKIPEGRQSRDVAALVHGELRIALIAALQRVRREQGPLSFAGLRQQVDGNERVLELEVEAFSLGRSGQHVYFAAIREAAPRPSLEAPPANPDFDVAGHAVGRIEQLEEELRYTREHLQTTIEAVETSNEELQSTNEELIAANEELQSTNEELHSVNEELHTVNAEYQRKIEELTELTNDMTNLFRSTDVATLFLDPELKIRKFTPKTAEFFHVVDRDVGRPIESFRHRLQHDRLTEDLKSVLVSGVPIEREVMDERGLSLFLRLLPYQTQTGIGGVVMSLIDITKLRKAEADLGEKNELLQGILNNAPAPISVKDLDGRYLLLNRGCAEVLGGTEQEIRGRTDFDYLPRETAQAIHAHEQRVSVSGGVVSVEEVLQVEGVLRTFLAVKFPVRSSNGAISGVASVATDITERKRAGDAVKEALIRRDEFLAMLSHELRNPLAAIQNATVLMARAPDATLAESARHVVERQTTHIARLLDDLLDVARLTQRKFELRRERVDLREMVQDILISNQRLVEDKQITLTVEVGDQPLKVDGDPARLLQAQINLLNNALKYTPHGGSVWFRIERSRDRIEVRVRDTGVGLSREELEKIFELFVQVDDSLDRTAGGLGVGLTLARMIAELHGGDVRGYSDGHGRGSEFVLSLPAAGEGAAKSAKRAPGARALPRRVVIVEDNEDTREMLISLLQLEQFEVQTATDGLDGAELIIRQKPDVALVDIGLPRRSGYELAKEVRAQLGTDCPTLIALTGYGRPEDRRAVMDAGFDAHVVKPVQFDELIRLMRDMARNPGAEPK